MFPIHPAYLAHQRRRFTRPDAYRFIRPDWRRYVLPGSELAAYHESIEQKYRPDQARVPAGGREGGQWTDEGGGNGGRNDRGTTRQETDEFSAARRGKGHHYVPGAVVRSRGVSEEAKEVFEKSRTGPLDDVRSNKWDEAHRTYNKAVGQALDEYLLEKGIRAEDMMAEQAREFLGRIFESPDLRIRNYNMGIQIREIIQRLRRRGGRE
jgi:hypothetical protein